MLYNPFLVFRRKNTKTQLAPSMKYATLALYFLTALFSGTLALFAREPVPRSFIPSHESAIRMLAVHNDFLYALDEGGLLTITKVMDTHASQTEKTPSHSYTVLHRPSAIHDAKFLYPYIIFTASTIDYDIVYVYHIAQRYIVFSAPYKRGTAHAFSPSQRLFSYVNNSGRLVVVTTATWKQQQEHAIALSPSFIAISHTEKNIMLYDAKGTIVYKNLYSGEVLKRVATLDALKHLRMNDTRRFAVGIPGNSLAVVDLVNGKMVDTIVISSTPRQVFSVEDSNKVISLGSFSDSSQILQGFDLSKSGQLVEEDSLTIENDAHVSAVFASAQKLHIGFEDGSVSVYDMQDKRLSPVLFDKTIANYDVRIAQNTLFFANVDGIRSIPLSLLMDNTRDEQLVPQFIPQMLISPIFASTTTAQSLPYVVSRAQMTPLLFKLSAAEGQAAFRLLPPLQLSLVPSTVIAHGAHLFAYSQQLAKAQLIHHAPYKQNTAAPAYDTSPLSQTNTATTPTTTPYKSSEFLMPHTSSAFDFNANSTLFTNAALHQQTDEKAASHLLHAYRVLQDQASTKEAENVQQKTRFEQAYALQFPFSMDDVLYIRNLPSEVSRRFILVRRVPFIVHGDIYIETLLVDYPMGENAGEKRIVVLAREAYGGHGRGQGDFVYQTSGDIVKLIRLDSNAMFLSVANMRTMRAISHTSIPYPQQVASIRSAHIADSFLTAVDQNNVVFVAKVGDYFIDIQQIMMLSQTNKGRVKLLREQLH